MNSESLFKPFSLKSLTLKNRVVMAPMSRYFASGGIPVADSVAYYANRAKGNVGLILSEGTGIDRVASTNDPNIPHFYGEPALSKWADIISGVHAAGGKMGCSSGIWAWSRTILPVGFRLRRLKALQA